MLLNEQELDVFTELINIGVGKAVGLLNELVTAPIVLSVPKIMIETLDDLLNKLEEGCLETYYAVKLNFEGSFSGVAEIVFPSDSGNNLVSILTGEEKYSEELDNLRVGTLNEVANMLLNGVMGSISNLIKEEFEYSVPVYYEDTFRNLVFEKNASEKVVLYGKTHFMVKDLSIEGDIIVLLELPSFNNLKAELNKLIEGII